MYIVLVFPFSILLFVRGILYLFLGIVGAYAGSAVFLMTPGAQQMYALMQELTAAGITDPYELLENEAYVTASMAMAPYMMVAAGVMIAPVAYRLRFAEFALMDMPRQGALRSVIQSWRMTRKNCWSLLKLDLHFWWFYLAQVLILGLNYGDLLLERLGVELTISADAMVFAFYVVALLCEFALYVWKKNEVFSVYTLAYDQLMAPREETPKPQPKNVPWN